VLSARTESVGVLVIRAWFDDGERFRVRMTGTRDVLEGTRTTTVVDSVEEAIAVARLWLEAFTNGRDAPVTPP